MANTKQDIAIPSFTAHAKACHAAMGKAGAAVNIAFANYVDKLRGIPRTEAACKAAQARMIADSKPFIEKGLARSSMYNYIKCAIIAHAMNEEFSPSALNRGVLAWSATGQPSIAAKQSKGASKPKGASEPKGEAKADAPQQPVKSNVQVTLSGIEAHLVDLYRRKQFDAIKEILASEAKKSAE